MVLDSRPTGIWSVKKGWEGSLSQKKLTIKREAFAKPRAYDLSSAKDLPFDRIGSLSANDSATQNRFHYLPYTIDCRSAHLQTPWKP